MKLKALPVLLLFLLSSLVSSQRPSNTVTVFTSLVLSTGFGGNRQPTVATATVLITSTITPASSTPTGSSTASNNGTLSASSSRNATTSATSSLPTAPTTVIAGGISGIAPVPGQTGGPFGPGDGFIAAATTLQRNAFLVGLGGCVVGGALVIL